MILQHEDDCVFNVSRRFITQMPCERAHDEEREKLIIRAEASRVVIVFGAATRSVELFLGHFLGPFYFFLLAGEKCSAVSTYYTIERRGTGFPHSAVDLYYNVAAIEVERKIPQARLMEGHWCMKSIFGLPAVTETASELEMLTEAMNKPKNCQLKSWLSRFHVQLQRWRKLEN